jgi:hypothetical protein
VLFDGLLAVFAFKGTDAQVEFGDAFTQLGTGTLKLGKGAFTLGNAALKLENAGSVDILALVEYLLGFELFSEGGNDFLFSFDASLKAYILLLKLVNLLFEQGGLLDEGLPAGLEHLLGGFEQFIKLFLVDIGIRVRPVYGFLEGALGLEAHIRKARGGKAQLYLFGLRGYSGAVEGDEGLPDFDLIAVAHVNLFDNPAFEMLDGFAFGINPHFAGGDHCTADFGQRYPRTADAEEDKDYKHPPHDDAPTVGKRDIEFGRGGIFIFDLGVFFGAYTVAGEYVFQALFYICHGMYTLQTLLKY